MAQKLDLVMSTMCLCIVLLEDRHISSNAADQWQQFLHQQHFSVILLVDFSVLFCSLAFLDPRVGHTMDVLSPFISILCHSD